MRVSDLRLWSVCVACVVVAPLAAAQPTEREIELARMFVHEDEKEPQEYPVTLESLQRDFDRASPPYADDIKAWMLGNFPAAQAKAIATMEGNIETRLVDALVERFTEADLELLVQSQAYLRSPQIVAVMDAPDMTSVQKIETLRQTMPPEEFETFLRSVMAPQLVAVPGLLQRVAVAFSAEYTERLDDAFREHCASAPPGVRLCADN